MTTEEKQLKKLQTISKVVDISSIVIKISILVILIILLFKTCTPTPQPTLSNSTLDSTKYVNEYERKKLTDNLNVLKDFDKLALDNLRKRKNIVKVENIKERNTEIKQY
jgi:hypothetical protein